MDSFASHRLDRRSETALHGDRRPQGEIEPGGMAADDMSRKLGLDETGRGRWQRGLIALALLALALGALALISQRFFGPAEVQYTTVAATRGDLVVAVTATGSLEVVNQVEVGSELSGVIETLHADFNDRVSEGQILAVLDREQPETEVRRSRAALQAAQARVLEAEATVTEAELELGRVSQLVRQTWRAEAELDTAQAAYDRAAASLAVARAEVGQAEAQLRNDETALSKTVIRSPIDGIVLERQVEAGQTIVASLEAPHLFTLAEDLARLELYVDIDEADIGQVQDGQSAVFSVDAYPERTFSAKITEVRFAPQRVDAVVTYEALLAVDNDDLSLRPGMTATAEITTKRMEDVLQVPTAAFRFRPDDAESTPDGEAAAERRRLWVLRDGSPVPVEVTPGLSDGRMIEIREGSLEAGTPVIVDARDLS